MDLQNKIAWCELGVEEEKAFLRKYGSDLDLKMNPQKSEQKTAIDLYHTVDNLYADLKSQSTPFFMAEKKYGIDPQYAVTFNRKDMWNYEGKSKKIGEIYIYFWVRWKDEERYGAKVKAMEGVWRIKFSDLLGLLDDSKLHRYRQRVGDKNGNAKDSFVVDLRQMEVVI